MKHAKQCRHNVGTPRQCQGWAPHGQDFCPKHSVSFTFVVHRPSDERTHESFKGVLTSPCPACKALGAWGNCNCKPIEHGRFQTEDIPPIGRKDDAAKPRPSLLPFRALNSVINVLEFGARKYGADNWRKVEAKRYVDAALRHLIAYCIDPSSVDVDTGESHLSHLVCCALFLMDHPQTQHTEAP